MTMLKVTTTIGLLAFIGTLLPAVAHAEGAVSVGPINPANLSPAGASGITFDGSPDPLVIDGWGHAIWRLDHGNASVVTTYALGGPEANMRSLAYDPVSHLDFTTRDTSLLTVNPAAGALTPIGTLGSFNFESLAVHPSTGALWMVNDCADPACISGQGAQLWTVNKTTGSPTRVYDFTSAGIGQATALAISNTGAFYVATLSTGGYTSIWRLDPVTGSATFVMWAGLGFLSVVNGMAFDPSTQRLYGIEEQRLAQPRAWNLVELVLPSLDGDGDGVPNASDRCLATAPGSIIDANGCSIEDTCPCSGGWSNHGAYQQCVTRTAATFLASGLITSAQKDATVSAAAQSRCGG